MHDVGVELVAQRREAFLDRAAAGDAEDVGEEEDSQFRTSDAAGRSSTDTWLPASFVYRASACRSTARGSTTVPMLRRAADDVRADLERRIGTQLRERDDERRRALRLDVDARAEAMAGDDVRRDADDGAVDRRVHVGAGRRADVERGRRAAVELVPDRMSAAAAEDLVEHALHDAFVALLPERRERHRAVGRRSGSRSPSTGPARSASAAGPRRASRRSAGTAASASLAARFATASAGALRAPPPNAVSSRAITSTIARRVRSAKRRARRAARTSRRSTRRLRLGREDGMSGGTVSNGRASVNRGGRAGSSQSSVERSSADDVPVLEPRRRPSRPPRYHRSHAGSRRRQPRIEIPRWMQLVGLPLLLVLVWVVAGAVRHVVFIFLVALLIALLLNPLVRGLGRVWIPRGLAVAIVYLAFAAALALAILALATVVVQQTRHASHRVDNYFTVDVRTPSARRARRTISRASSTGSTRIT